MPRIVEVITNTLEAQLPIYWVPVLKTLYNYILSVAQGPTIWVPGLLGTIVYVLWTQACENSHGVHHQEHNLDSTRDSSAQPKFAPPCEHERSTQIRQN